MSAEGMGKLIVLVLETVQFHFAQHVCGAKFIPQDQIPLQSCSFVDRMQIFATNHGVH